MQIEVLAGGDVWIAGARADDTNALPSCTGAPTSADGGGWEARLRAAAWASQPRSPASRTG
ncbi:hypothetical protein [Sandaracinus amylolyticus]|uniref:hypothetical protein n=1 Tax=Sandaracinus amylolyticus TaxID=927083 RepID=UPI001F2E6E4D|nr:hypothetical protein [Sandaracinus amylolyticus]UJR83880.1 Hypothetical protein I5071_59510 [Sandaracinus amylolyticus]